MFYDTQGEYEQEGVVVTRVSYEDNRPLLELLLTVNYYYIIGERSEPT